MFDYSKHPSTPPDNQSHPQHRCSGHSLEGYGLAWSPHTAGLLLSGSDDATICTWDLTEAGQAVSATATRKGHTSVVEDVDFHKHYPHMFGSVGDDGRLLIWDLREGGDRPAQAVMGAHDGDANCLSFSPANEFLLATGGSDAVVNIWDLRALGAGDASAGAGAQAKPLHSCASHRDGVFQVSWSPHAANILASCSSDRRLIVWDLARIGAEQSAEDAADGPPEVLFVHGGHTAKVSDFSWSASEPWTLASVAEDNILHVWQPAGTVYLPEGGAAAASAASAAATAGAGAGAGAGGEVGDDDLEGGQKKRSKV